MDQSDPKTSEHKEPEPSHSGESGENRKGGEPGTTSSEGTAVGKGEGEQEPLVGTPLQAQDEILGDEKGSLDLEALGAGGPPSPPAPPKTIPYNPAEHRENVRGDIAKWLIQILAAIILLSFILLTFKPESSEKLKEILSIVFGPLVALVGAATGYYFGAKSNGKD